MKYQRAALTLAAAVVTWALLRFLVPFEVVRAANVVLSLVAGLWFGMRVNDMWRYLSYGRRLTFTALAAGLLIAAYGSAELYIQQVEGGERIYFWSVMTMSIIAGLWFSRHEPRTYP